MSRLDTVRTPYRTQAPPTETIMSSLQLRLLQVTCSPASPQLCFFLWVLVLSWLAKDAGMAGMTPSHRWELQSTGYPSDYWCPSGNRRVTPSAMVSPSHRMTEEHFVAQRESKQLPSWASPGVSALSPEGIQEGPQKDGDVAETQGLPSATALSSIGLGRKSQDDGDLRKSKCNSPQMR